MTEIKQKRGLFERFLGGVERVGNKIPDAMLLFIYLSVAVVIISGICGAMGISVINPVSGEEEDTDVGFPGPEHHIAEHAMPMKVAMSMPHPVVTPMAVRELAPAPVAKTSGMTPKMKDHAVISTAR